ncbi:hypothetical protein BDQ17DRAFT_1182614, partial [Cyathus striatus]
LSRILGIDKKTLCYSMKKCRISHQFSSISDQRLDKIVRKFKSRKPNSDFRYLMAYLRAQGIRVQC